MMTKNSIIFLIIILISAIGAYLFPASLLIILFFNIIITVIFGIARISALFWKKYKPKRPVTFNRPKVSIHVPAYNEPPELMINTLKALSKLNYDNYEVIVLDNNTPDEETWRPVQEYCATLGDKFRFYHKDNVKGFKAGALNISYELTAKDAEFILVIDADYVLDADILSRALPHFEEPKVGLVQFPQAYMNVDANNAAMKNEYRHFFSVYMNVANHCNAVLSTGTVSFVRIEALEKAGLWRGQSITEDVDLGLNIHEAGYCGVFVNEPMGRGLMPADMDSLSVQRERWVYGNMQTLMRFLKEGDLSSPKILFSNLLFLTAWFNFLLLPMLVLIFCTVFHFIDQNSVWHSIGSFALINIVTDISLTFLFFIMMPIPEAIKDKFGAFLHHLSLAYEGALNWIKVPLFPNMGFKRTNKFLGLGTNFQFSGNFKFILILTISNFILFNEFLSIQMVLFTLILLFVAASAQLRMQLRHTSVLSRQFYETEIEGKKSATA